MKIGCFVAALRQNRDDQWATTRCEGRCSINAGFGFGLLGHSVDIINMTFPAESKEVFPNVSLRKSPEEDTNKPYDVFFGYDIPPLFSNYKRSIHLFEPSAKDDVLVSLPKRFPRASFFVLNSKVIPAMEKVMKQQVRFFPMLFPNPSYPGLETQDFKDFKFDPSKKEIVLWLYSSSWANYYIECDQKIVYFVNYMKSKGYKISIKMFWNGIDTIKPPLSTLIDSGTVILNSKNMCYLDVLKSIESADICLTKGGPFYCGNCAFDILSMGKPLVYVTEGTHPNNINDLYPVEQYVLRQEDSNSALDEKIGRFLTDPKKSWETFVKEVPFNFPRWKEIVTPILKSLE